MTDAVLSNLSLSALALAAFLLPLWLLSLKLDDASIIDIFWGFGFVVVAAVCYYIAPYPSPYLWLLTAMPVIWGLRLTVYLGKRNIGHGEDERYTNMRKRKAAQNWPLYTLLYVFTLQGVLIAIVSAPVWWGIASGHVNAVEIGLLSYVGFALWAIGFLFEAVGDWQLARFIKSNRSYDGPYENKPVLDTGLWKYTRHPNYFGNACMWWGIWIVACQAPWGWVTVFAPLIMNLFLLKISGRDLLERKLKTRPAYRDYVARTSSFFPLPPKSS